MTDHELLQEALDALEEYCEHNVMLRPIEKREALRARLSTCDRCGKVNPAELHTCTPPQRESVGLTKEEIAILWKATPLLVGVYSYTDIALEVQAKLKEKNT